MPKYEITRLYHVWTRHTVEADNEEDALEYDETPTLDDPKTWIDQSYKNCWVEETSDA